MSLEVQVKDSDDVKQFQLRRAIERLDRKLARKWILVDGIKPTAIQPTHLLRFLRVAVETRDPSLVRKLLEQKPELNSAEGGQILWLVAEDGDTEIATMLVLAGADLNEPMRGSNFLHVLISSGNPRKHQLALLMLEKGADVNVLDYKNHSALYYAVKHDLAVLIIELLRRDAIVRDDVIVHAASNLKAVELLPMLIRTHGADETMTRDRQAISAITYLIMQDGNVDIIKILLDIGIPVDLVNSFGWTSLVFATIFERVRVVELLLNYGADVNKKTKNGILPVYTASGLEESTILKMFIRKGANIHDHNEHDLQYPIHAACASESFANIHLLRSLGADINVVDRSDRTPFSLMDTTESLNHPTKYIIKHLALMTSKGLTIRDLDVSIINESSHTQSFYEHCLEELSKMKILNIYNDISFFSVFEKNIQELSLLVRNSDFVKSYYRSRRKSLFHIYFRDMSVAFKSSEKRKNILVFKENTLNKITNRALPDITVRKIAYYVYLNELKSFRKMRKL